jgi:RNA polymerase sigma-70 factor (ECF subfamily)
MPPTSAEDRFTEIYAEHRHAVYAYFLGRTDASAAPDLLQETFLRVWRRLDEVRDLQPDKQRAWIFTVARNLTIDSYRSGATRKATESALRAVTTESVASGEQPETRAEQAEQLRILAAAIAELPESQRLVITMQASGGLTSAQIGEALGEPAGTVRYRLSEARKTLARKLEGVSA